MNFAFRFALAVALGFAGSAVPTYAQAPAAPAPPEGRAAAPATVTPVPRDGNWMNRHEAMNARVKQGDVNLVFIGDSITAGWEGAGKKVWQEHYGDRNAVNLGIGGDRTQHVLWRLQNGNLEGIEPELAVIMIGTNNSGGDSPEDIAAGVKSIVELIRQKTPETKILLLATFPRGEKPEDPRRQTNEKSNAIVKQLADDQRVFFLDIGDKFLEADGTLSKETMPDLLHLNEKSYAIWAEAIEPTVAKLMGDG
ncbi:MAG TPA: platelet-activating factor acetylhydrolase IB subunit [Pirellulaceae bacterium]|jgi:beta-glucosidase|nr:platelet-activating factor acetylhydrolase IB subunit [Pirellulaceae bacterium]